MTDRKNSAKQTIAALSLKMSAAAMLLTCIGLALPRLSELYGFLLWQQALLVSLQYVGFTVAVIIGGALSDRFGQRRVMTASLIGAALAAAVFGSITSYAAAVAAALMIGAAGSILENAITAIVMRRENDRRDRHNVLVQVAFSAGAMMLPLIYLLSLKVLGSWRVAYYFAAAFSLVLIFVSKNSEPKTVKAGSRLRSIFEPYKGFAKNPRNFIAPAAMFLYLGAEIGIWAFAPLYFESNGFGVLSGIITSVSIWFLMMLGRMLTAKLIKKGSAVGIMTAAAAVEILVLGALFFSGMKLSVALIAAAGFLCAPFFPLIMSWMVEITGNESSSMIAVTMSVGTLGPVILSAVTGVFSQLQGSRYMMMVPALCFAALLAMLIIFNDKRIRNINERHIGKE